MSTNQDDPSKECPGMPLNFSLNVGYERSAIMGTGKNHRELAKRIKKKLYRDVFPEDKRAEWKYQDAIITAEINRIANQEEGMGDESSKGFNTLLPESMIEEVIRPIALEVFADEDSNFAALLKHLNERLALLPTGLEAKRVELFGCRYCGPPPCWEFTAQFSICQQGSNEAHRISIEVPSKKGEIARPISVPVLVCGTFTCSDRDYKVVFDSKRAAVSAGQ